MRLFFGLSNWFWYHIFQKIYFRGYIFMNQILYHIVPRSKFPIHQLKRLCTKIKKIALKRRPFLAKILTEKQP